MLDESVRHHCPRPTVAEVVGRQNPRGARIVEGMPKREFIRCLIG